MKTISLRQFRDSVADLTEPVIVIKREGSEVRTLGQWTPTIVHSVSKAEIDECYCEVCTAAMLRLQPILPARSFGHPSPAPKGRRK